MLRLVQTLFSKSATPQVRQLPTKTTMASRRINTKSTLPNTQSNQELQEAYEEACERVCNERAAYYSKFRFTPYQEDGMIPRESMSGIREFEERALEAKLEQLYPWPKKPGLR